MSQLIKQCLNNSNNNILFRQLFDGKSSTYTYLLADAKTKESIIIDPVYEQVSRDIRIIKELQLDLKYAINTHVHADHVTGSGEIKKMIDGCKSVISKSSGATADLYVCESDRIEAGCCSLKVLETPGHTNGCVTYYLENCGMAFTGDSLLIRGCGRTDFQEGCSKILYQSIHNKIFKLPQSTLLYPGHDYSGQTVSSVREEKCFNPRLTKTLDEFIQIMKNLNLNSPKNLGYFLFVFYRLNNFNIVKLFHLARKTKQKLLWSFAKNRVKSHKLRKKIQIQ